MAFDLSLLYGLNTLAGKSFFVDALIIFFASYFQYVLVAVFLFLLHISAYPARQKLRIFRVTAVSIIVSRFGVTEFIRLWYHRPRPFVAHPLHQLIFENEWSFPSGHAAFFFAMAAAIYCYNKKWGAWFFTAALLMTISRVIAGAHYPSDILGGMIVGACTAFVVFYLAEQKSKKIPRA